MIVLFCIGTVIVLFCISTVIVLFCIGIVIVLFRVQFGKNHACTSEFFRLSKLRISEGRVQSKVFEKFTSVCFLKLL